MSEQGAFAEWVVLELMGHRRLAGRLTEQEIAGDGFLRLDVYPGNAEAPAATQLYRPGAVYCITPTTEDVARKVAARAVPQPVQRWELEPPRARQVDPDPDGEDPAERKPGCICQSDDVDDVDCPLHGTPF